MMMNNGIHTAPPARIVPLITIVTPKKMKFHAAISWMWRAIGTAGLSPPRNSAKTCRSTSRIISASAPVITKLTIIPALVSSSSRCHCFAPIYCAAIALIAPPIAIAGIWM